MIEVKIQKQQQQQQTVIPFFSDAGDPTVEKQLAEQPSLPAENTLVVVVV